MIIFENRKLIEAKFDSEKEIEDVVIANSEHFFGPSSILIPKKLIRTKDGFGTIPDGFAIDLASRIWYVVEAELAQHSVWTHIAPQVTKQLIAVSRPETRQLLVEMLVEMITEDDLIKEKFAEEGIKEIDIRKVLGDILESSPIIGMPIDSVSSDLADWAETLKNDVRLWIVKKYVEFGSPEVIAYDIPEEYRPVLDTSKRDMEPRSGITVYDVSITDLLESGLLNVGDTLLMNYKPRGGTPKTYRATIEEDGSLMLLDKKFSSSSYAALYGIQDAGSERTTVNGWTSWKTKKGKYLADLRSEYMEMKEREAQKAGESEEISL